MFFMLWSQDSDLEIWSETMVSTLCLGSARGLGEGLLESGGWVARSSVAPYAARSTGAFQGVLEVRMAVSSGRTAMCGSARSGQGMSRRLEKRRLASFGLEFGW